MKVVTLAFGLLSVAGCVHASEGLVREQAAAAFSCADYALDVEEVGPDEYRASGCGQALIYTCHRPVRAASPSAAAPEGDGVGNSGADDATECTRRPQ